MTSEDRVIDPSAPLGLVEANGEANSYTIGASWFNDRGDLFNFRTGIDYTMQERRMLRSRHLKNGLTLEDLIWPDIEAFQAGVFFEIKRRFPGKV